MSSFLDVPVCLTVIKQQDTSLSVQSINCWASHAVEILLA